MFKKLALALAALSSLSSGAVAAIVDSGPISIPVGNNIDGVYVNLVSGASGTTGGAVAGWDFNAYNASTTAPGFLAFFWPTNATANSNGGVAAGTVYTNVTDGTVVGPASTFTAVAGGSGAANFVNFSTAGPKVLGVRFQNEPGNTVHYGYVRMDKGAAGGFPATITRIVFDNTPNTAVTVVPAGGGGANPTYSSVPAPGTAVNLSATGTANLVITNSGAAGAGALNVTAAGLSGVISVTPATAAVAQGANATLVIRCANTTAAAVTQTLSVTHNGTAPPASPATHVVTCAAAAAAAPVVQAPAFGSFGLLGMMLGFLGLGVFAARRYS
jgi:hypothetical protein